MLERYDDDDEDGEDGDDDYDDDGDDDDDDDDDDGDDDDDIIKHVQLFSKHLKHSLRLSLLIGQRSR